MSDTTLNSIFSPEEYAKLKHAADLLHLTVEQLIRNAALQLLYQRRITGVLDTDLSDDAQVVKLEGLWENVSLNVRNSDIRRIRRRSSKELSKRSKTL